MTTTEPTHPGPINPVPAAPARAVPVGAARAPVPGRVGGGDRRASVIPPSAEVAAALLREQRIDAVLNDSFPASDPPGWTLGHTG